MIGGTRARRRPARALAFACLLAPCVFAFSGAEADALRDRLETLAAERGFQLEGLERIGEETARPADRHDPAEQIRRLLTDYNFVIARDERGRITRLTIVGMRATPVMPPPTRTDTGQPRKAPGIAEHYVDANLVGPNGRQMPLRVMIDTGASTLVLPRSMAEKLGFAARYGTDVRVQTANGMTAGVLASLEWVRVGEAEARDVAVTFVEDHLLGGKQLLGMSFLGRFRMTIDGHTGALDLEARTD